MKCGEIWDVRTPPPPPRLSSEARADIANQLQRDVMVDCASNWTARFRKLSDSIRITAELAVAPTNQRRLDQIPTSAGATS